MDRPVLQSKWDVTDAFHRCNIKPSDVGAFAYVVPPLPSDTSFLLCINLVLPMGWVNSPDFFCAASETVVDITNDKITSSPPDLVAYGPTKALYSTAPHPQASEARLQCADVYMDDLICLAQGSPEQQQRVTEHAIRSIKEVFPSLPNETKNSVSVVKALKGDRNWAVSKEILG